MAMLFAAGKTPAVKLIKAVMELAEAVLKVYGMEGFQFAYKGASYTSVCELTSESLSHMDVAN
jgi:hypothetical protein